MLKAKQRCKLLTVDETVAIDIFRAGAAAAATAGWWATAGHIGRAILDGARALTQVHLEHSRWAGRASV